MVSLATNRAEPRVLRLPSDADLVQAIMEHILKQDVPAPNVGEDAQHFEVLNSAGNTVGVINFYRMVGNTWNPHIGIMRYSLTQEETRRMCRDAIRMLNPSALVAWMDKNNGPVQSLVQDLGFIKGPETEDLVMYTLEP